MGTYKQRIYHFNLLSQPSEGKNYLVKNNKKIIWLKEMIAFIVWEINHLLCFVDDRCNHEWQSREEKGRREGYEGVWEIVSYQ